MKSSNKVLSNVEYIINKYGSKLESDNHLLVLYWKMFDKIEVTKSTIDTQQFILKSTNSSDILNAKLLLEAMKEWVQVEDYALSILIRERNILENKYGMITFFPSKVEEYDKKLESLNKTIEYLQQRNVQVNT